MSAATMADRERLGPMLPSYLTTYRTWEGYLTLANAEAVRDRMVREFGGRTFTSCVANGFFRFRPEVFPGCRLRAEWTDRSPDLVKLSRSTLEDGREMAHLMWSAGGYSWGIHTTSPDQDAAHAEDDRSCTRVTFTRDHGGWQMRMALYTPAGDQLYWVLATADEDDR